VIKVSGRCLSLHLSLLRNSSAKGSDEGGLLTRHRTASAANARAGQPELGAAGCSAWGQTTNTPTSLERDSAKGRDGGEPCGCEGGLRRAAMSRPEARTTPPGMPRAQRSMRRAAPSDPPPPPPGFLWGVDYTSRHAPGAAEHAHSGAL